MAYYYDGVKCDTLAELNSLRQSRGAQPMVAAHSSNQALFHESKAGSCVENGTMVSSAQLNLDEAKALMILLRNCGL